jgi:glycosyltransferase involved in cell wall biosynthesis
VLVELYIFAFISIAYGALITTAIIGFNKLKRTLPAKPPEDHLFISIVLSARNEAPNISQCIHQIEKQNFPNDCFEVILVDDHSDDETYQLAQTALLNSGITHEVIRQSSHRGKKHNLALAIQKSRGSIIVTTDADITYRHPNWILTISNYFKTYSPNLLVMPVDFENKSGLIETFQIIENLALTGVTAGYAGIQKPFLCNGANLAFKKSVYEKVNRYESHKHISSGEDVFLLEEIKKINSSSIHYVLLRELIVKTAPIHSLKDLLQQRLRWAYKAKYNPNHFNLFAGFIIMAANLLFLALFVAILKKSVIIPYLSIFALSKFVFDFLLLFLASDFLGRVKYIWWLIPFECVYWMYTLIVGIVSLFYKPYWKGKKTT